MIWIWPVGEFVALFGAIGGACVAFLVAKGRAHEELRAPRFVALLYGSLPLIILKFLLMKSQGGTGIIFLADYFGTAIVAMIIVSPFAAWGRSNGVKVKNNVPTFWQSLSPLGRKLLLLFVGVVIFGWSAMAVIAYIRGQQAIYESQRERQQNDEAYLKDLCNRNPRHSACAK